MMRKSTTILLALGLSVFPLAGCGSVETEPESEVARTSAPAAIDETAPGLLNYEWHLEAFGKLGEEDELVPGTSITLTFKEGGTLTGTAGCNHYSTTFRTGPSGEFSTRALATSRMACEEPTMVQEQTYLEAFKEATSFDVGADRLQLFYGESEYALLFKGLPKEEDESGD